MMKSVALLGYPLRHSISPVFQQVAFDYYHLDVLYEPWEVPPNQLKKTVVHIRESSVLGANVTIPHKESVLPLMDRLDGIARDIGAVNTIVNRDGELVGHNTDAEGFIRALKQEGGFDPEGKRVVFLGAGGAARAVGFALMKAGARSITIVNRTYERSRDLVLALRGLGELDIVALPMKENILAEVVGHSDLLVNCTSLGMKHSANESVSPLKASSIPSGVLVYDLVYNPPETPLLKEAKHAGAKRLGGLSMLVYQGAVSFELWTERQAPVELMLKAAREAL